MRFDLIQVADDAVHFEWTEKLENGMEHSHVVGSGETPAPTLPASLAAFKPYFRELLGVGESWNAGEDGNDGIEIRKLHLKEDAQTKLRTLQLTVIVRLWSAGGKAVTINTPTVRARGDTEGGHFLDARTLKLIARAEDAAEGFVRRGERGQAEMFPTDATQARENDADGGHAETPNGAKPKGGRRKRSDISRDGHPVTNPDATLAPTDELIRTRLLEADVDVPLDAIAQWTSSERNEALEWATTAALRKGQHSADIPEPPPHVATVGTPSLADEWRNAPQRQVSEHAPEQLPEQLPESDTPQAAG